MNAGTISQSFSTATVTLNGLDGNTIYAGGLAGQNSGDITNTFASGGVTANGVAGEGGGGHHRRRRARRPGGRRGAC